MAPQRLPNYLKAYRKRLGLSQYEVAFLVGNSDGGPLCRYEKHQRIPPLETALAFEAIFKTPVAELFAGLRDAVSREVARRMNQFVLQLQQEARLANGGETKKLRWLAETHGFPVSAE